MKIFRIINGVRETIWLTKEEIMDAYIIQETEFDTDDVILVTEWYEEDEFLDEFHVSAEEVVEHADEIGKLKREYLSEDATIVWDDAVRWAIRDYVEEKNNGANAG